MLQRIPSLTLRVTMGGRCGADPPDDCPGRCENLTSNGPLQMLDRLKAQMLLSECNGRDIWPVELCREKGIPDAWIDELADRFESGFQSPFQTIYVGDRLTNQFYGVHDLHLAYKLGEYLGVPTEQVTAGVFGRVAEVRAIQQAVEEG
jgi:hypothetical protein